MSNIFHKLKREQREREQATLQEILAAKRKAIAERKRGVPHVNNNPNAKRQLNK